MTKKYILLIEPMGNSGHKDINEHMIEILSKNYNIEFVSEKNYIDTSIYQDLIYRELPKEYCLSNLEKKGKIINRIVILKAFNWIFNNFNFSKYDYIIFMEYELIAFFLSSFLYKKFNKNILLLNHTNIDEVCNSKIKRMVFKKLHSNIKFLCYEDFITDYVRDNFNKTVYTLKHNLNLKKIELIEDKTILKNKDISVVCPSNNSLSDHMLEKIIELDKNLELDGVNIIIKSNKLVYNGNNVIIINNYLSEKEYINLINQSDFVLLPYNSTKWQYNYRVSGVFFDCITLEKPMIYFKTKFFKHINQKYSNYGIGYDSDEELLDILVSGELKKYNCIELNRNIINIKNEYSDEHILENIESIFKELDRQ